MPVLVGRLQAARGLTLVNFRPESLSVDDEVWQEALGLLEAEDVQELRIGGQKMVRLVRVGGTECVLKVVAIESDAPDALRRAQREVELLQTVDSDYVVKVASDLVELGDPVVGAAWLEEYLDGADLADELGDEWEWERARDMARDIAAGLGAMHDVKVVHRDLSASNVRHVADARYVVMDPGFARHTLRSGLTLGGQPGTLGFLSPEHLQSYSGSPTPASDVFCVGVLLYAALTGQQPIPYEGDPGDYLQRLFEVEVTDIGQARPDLPVPAMELIRSMLHPQPARRPRNGNQLASSLEALN